MPLTLKRTWRILLNIATGAEASRGYPARAVEILRNRTTKALRWEPQVVVDRTIETVWSAIPQSARSSKYPRALGRRIHQRAARVHQRGGACYTRFFRNPPQLQLVRDLVLDRPSERPVRIMSLGCSTGAELYSLLWLIRTARPAQPIQALGLDMAEDCIQAASSGVYPFRAVEVAKLSETSHARFFSKQGKTLVIQDWVKDAVTWIVGDACSATLPAQHGVFDVVLANNFLFQMPPDRSEACLRNVARLVAPDGYLVASGVDLDLRSRVLLELGFIPVTAGLQEIHAAEDVLEAWPLRAWGLEPIDRTRHDWPARYVTVFRSPAAP